VTDAPSSLGVSGLFSSLLVRLSNWTSNKLETPYEQSIGIAWRGCLQLIKLEASSVQVPLLGAWVYSRRVRCIAEHSVGWFGQSMPGVLPAGSS
jgi:hypothetical protein